MSLISTIKEHVCAYYDDCNRPAFWFTIIIMSQLIGFIPSVPSIIIYICFVLYAIYVLTKHGDRWNKLLLTFLIYIPVQLLITNPDPMFHSWERFGLFVLLIICVSPLVIGAEAALLRKQIFEIAIIISVFIGVGSFFAYFLGINYGALKNSNVITAGVFGGLCPHSMLLGPFAGIGCVTCIYLALSKKNWQYWVLSACCIGAVFFSASRSSLIATVTAAAMVIYKVNGSSAKFTKTMVLIGIVAAITYPLWSSAMDMVIAKNNANIEAGGMLNSRDALWQLRWIEFESSPIFGIGFDSVDIRLAGSLGFARDSGMVESGSSWLMILSMTGIIGAILIGFLIFNSFISAYRGGSMYDALVCAILTLFLIHMIAEGYIYYGGSMLAFMLWVTIGTAYDCQFGNND